MAEFRTYKDLDEFIEAMEELENQPENESIEFVFDHDRKIVILTDQEGTSAEVPVAHFEEIMKMVGGPCLLCRGKLGLVVFFELEELMFLGCDSCDSYYTVRDGKLRILDWDE